MSLTNYLRLQMTAENMNNQEMGQPAELFIKKLMDHSHVKSDFLVGRSKIPKNNPTSYVNAPLDEIGVGHHDFILPV